jgi:hypothetical protein
MPPEEDGGFLAQQCVENLLKGLIVLAGEQPPLSHDLERLQQLAGVRLPEELLARIRQLREELECLLEGTQKPPHRQQLSRLKTTCLTWPGSWPGEGRQPARRNELQLLPLHPEGGPVDLQLVNSLRDELS